jgi:hypothetical protein
MRRCRLDKDILKGKGKHCQNHEQTAAQIGRVMGCVRDH